MIYEFFEKSYLKNDISNSCGAVDSKKIFKIRNFMSPNLTTNSWYFLFKAIYSHSSIKKLHLATSSISLLIRKTHKNVDKPSILNGKPNERNTCLHQRNFFGAMKASSNLPGFAGAYPILLSPFTLLQSNVTGRQSEQKVWFPFKISPNREMINWPESPWIATRAPFQFSLIVLVNSTFRILMNGLQIYDWVDRESQATLSWWRCGRWCRFRPDGLF